MVIKLDRLARSLPDARAIADELTVRRVRLKLGGSVYDPTDPVGRLLCNVLAMVADSSPTSFGCLSSSTFPTTCHTSSRSSPARTLPSASSNSKSPIVMASAPDTASRPVGSDRPVSLSWRRSICVVAKKAH